MKYFDRNTNTDRIAPDVRPLIRGMLNNKQLFDDDGADAPYVSDAIKYHRRSQDRRQTSPYSGDDSFVESILDVFDFDPLDFQVNSWQTVNALEEARRRDRVPQAAVFAAPTGFGKTEAFLGPLYQLLRENRHRSSIIVYPRRALLQNQLERILEHVHHLGGTEGISELSVGVYVGGSPYEISDVETNDTFFDNSAGRGRFKLASCWCGSEGQSNAFQYHGTSRQYILRCGAEPEAHTFTNSELLLSRTQMLNNQPDIILTTLESLELFGLKPNYDLIDQVDSIILDEMHLYTGLRGAHTANIIENINEITDHPILWMGASATIDDPTKFAKKLFDFSSSQIETERPPDSDFQPDTDDREHYYFMISPEDGPGASSMMIQQLMLAGHSLLQPAAGDRGKILSFIDSISQVNQKHAQLINADHQRELWRHHIAQSDEGDWQVVANEMGYEFLDEHLSFLPVYSDAGFDADAAASSDVLLSTSYLEVGIDVGDISIIGQYRTPQDLSSFIQRTGRAAREEETDSHILVFLTNLTGDLNMFYRAERFLGEDLRTPLKRDNQVVEWIHDQLASFYSTTVDIHDAGYSSPRQAELDFYERYLRDDVQFGEFYEFLTNPGDYLSDRLDIDEAPDEPLVTADALRTVEHALVAKQQALDDEFDEINEHIDVEGEAIVQSENAFDQYLKRVQRRVLALIDGYQDRLDTADEIMAAAGDDSQSAMITSIQEALNESRENVDDYRTLPNHDRVEEYQNLLVDLATIGAQLKGVVAHAQRHAPEESAIQAVELARIDDLQEAVDLLGGLAGDDRLAYLSQQRKQVYYLGKVLDQLKAYRNIDDDDGSGNDRPFLSLYYTKRLLRAGYYFERFLNVTDESMGEVWYVPPSYFESSGQYLTVFHGEMDADGTEESLDGIVHEYAPYQTEYQSETGQIQLFMPETTVVDPGSEDEHSTVVFDFSDVPGDHRAGMLVPDSITMTTVPDLTGNSARSIVQYCPQCLQILPEDGSCLRHNDRAYGKIYASPSVGTIVTDQRVDDQVGGLALCDLTAEIRLEGVSLDITPAEYIGGEIGYTWADEDRIQREIESPDRPLGFMLDTRGLVYDLDPFVDSLDTEIRDQVTSYKNLDEVDYEYLIYHTAAHYFLQLVSDISGVNPSLLFYGIDQSQGEILIFERTEGGQGVVDLVHEELTTDPGSVLETINRFGYNPQVINERLWATTAVVDELPARPLTEAEAHDLVSEYTDIPYEMVIEKITQEFISTAERADQLNTTENDIDLQTAYQIKHTIATEQIDDADAFPTSAVEGFGIDDQELLETIESLFYSPDIDGCVENLHLSECISGHSQEASLSYVVLEELREFLTDTVPTDQTTDRMFESERLPAAELDDTNVFLTF